MPGDVQVEVLKPTWLPEELRGKIGSEVAEPVLQTIKDGRVDITRNVNGEPVTEKYLITGERGLDWFRRWGWKRWFDDVELAGKTILDAPSGINRLAADINERLGHTGTVAIGVDLVRDPNLLSPECFVQQDMGQMKALASGVFDIAISSYGPFLVAPSHQIAQDLYRVLKPGGKLRILGLHEHRRGVSVQVDNVLATAGFKVDHRYNTIAGALEAHKPRARAFGILGVAGEAGLSRQK